VVKLRELSTGRRRAIKILMVAPTSFFSDYGGHIRILEETMALQSLGHSVTIVTYYKGKNIVGIDTRRTPALPWHPEYEVGSSRHKVAFDLYLAVKTIQVGLRMRPDIVHGHMHEGALIGALLARLVRAPLVFDFQGGLTGEMVDHGFLNPEGFVFPLVRRLEKFICDLPDAILTSSLRARGLLIDQFDQQDGRIFPLPDCVDTSRFDPSLFDMSERRVLRERLGIPLGRPIVVYLGLLAEYQGTPKLIETAARLRQGGEDVHFLIMGYPEVERYRQMASQHGVADRVTLTGKIDYEEAPRYLSLGDIAISTKMSATEGSGKVLNYMAMGQPVVAFDTPVHREYLGELGCYAPVGDVDGLTSAIQTLLCEPEQRHSLGGQLRDRAIQEYSWKEASKRIAETYEFVLKSAVKSA
jgi:glycosyltransferase involved in cell wall biosynthesis